MGGGSTDWSESERYDYSRKESVTRRSAADYAKEDKRSYTGHTSNGIPAPVGKEISTESSLAEIIVLDVTGSMREWPRLVIEKIPTLYSESNVGLQGIPLEDLEKGKDAEDLLELAVIAVGDARNPDRHPIQVVEFSKGPELTKKVNIIYPEGAGGPFGRESYELVAYYLDKHCKTPNVVGKPVLIWACDENFYDDIRPFEVKEYIGDDISQPLNSDDVMKSLMKKFDMYVLRPEPYSDGSQVYAKAHKHWESILGAQRVFKMEDPARLVDCVNMISAAAADNFDLGEKLLRRRQTPGQVEQVLRDLHKLPRQSKTKRDK